MLDAAYGLLDDAEVKAIETHAAACVACGPALHRSRNLQSLFARAAKMPFPEVVFDAKLAEVKTESNPKVTWLPWVMAAAVMLALGGVIASQAFKSAADKQVAAVNTEIPPTKPQDPPKHPPRQGPELRETAQKEWTVESKPESNKKYRLTVIGPEKPSPVSKASYSVTATDAVGGPLKVNVTLYVKDSMNGIFAKKVIESGTAFELPATVWSEATGAMSLEIRAVPPGGRKAETTEISISLR